MEQIIIKICIILISLSNIGLFFVINRMNKRIDTNELFICEITEILKEVFSKEDEDEGTE